MSKQIDKLKNKFKNNIAINLREACCILWLECFVCSAQYLAFAHWAKSNGISLKQKFGWAIWKSMFDHYASTIWQEHSKDIDLMVKIHKEGVTILGIKNINN